MCLSGSQQETDGTLKTGKFQEGLFTKGLFMTCGCWGTTRDSMVTWGLIAVKLLSLLGPKEWGGKRQLLEPGEKQFLSVGCLENSSLGSRNTTSYVGFLGRRETRGLMITLLPTSIPPGLPNKSKVDSVLSNRDQTQLQDRCVGNGMNPPDVLTWVYQLVLTPALYSPHFTDKETDSN